MRGGKGLVGTKTYNSVRKFTTTLLEVIEEGDVQYVYI